MIAITGVTGLIGANLARALVAEGQPVRGIIHRETHAVEGLRIELVRADLMDLPSLVDAFQGVEIVYHLAGYISLSEQDEDLLVAINIEGVRNVLAACRASGVRRLVHFSSIHALEQKPLRLPVDEQRPLAISQRHLPYDRSKAAGEALVRQAIAAGLNGIILNPTGILGPNDFKPSFFGQAILLMASGCLPVLVSGGFDWVDVRDVVSGAIQAAKTAPSGSRFLLSGHWRSVEEVANLIAEYFGNRPPRFRVPLWLAYYSAPLVGLFAMVNGSRPLYTRVSLEALRSNRQISHRHAAQLLGYQARPFEESLRDTLNWFLQHGYIRER